MSTAELYYYATDGVNIYNYLCNCYSNLHKTKKLPIAIDHPSIYTAAVASISKPWSLITSHHI